MTTDYYGAIPYNLFDTTLSSSQVDVTIHSSIIDWLNMNAPTSELFYSAATGVIIKFATEDELMMSRLTLGVSVLTEQPRFTTTRRGSMFVFYTVERRHGTIRARRKK